MHTHDFLRRSPSRLLAILLAIAAASPGCSTEDEPYAPPEYALVSVGGRVTVDGKPLAGAVVTFLQTDERGTTSGSDTDEDGRYELSYRGEPGTAAAAYKVAVSYKLGNDGKPLDRATRFSSAVANGGHLAKEQVPRQYSDLGRTVLRATVPPDGGNFDFDLEGPLLTTEPGEEGGARDGKGPREAVPKGPDAKADVEPAPRSQ